MADGTLPFPAPSLAARDGGSVMVALAGERYALPLASVEAIAPPPTLSRVPHAPPAVLGAGNLGGQVLPVIDLAALLPGSPARRRYDGSGEVVRIRAAGGSVGVWVDRVERLFDVGTAAESVAAIDPEPLIAAGLAAPALAPHIRHPLGDAREIADPQPVARIEAAYIAVEAEDQEFLLPQKAVLELTGPPPCVAVPGAPPGLYGVGIVRGDALPLLSLSALMGLPATRPPECVALLRLANHRLLLGFDRVIGLRTPMSATRRRRRRTSRIFNLTTTLPEELRQLVAAFAPPPAAGHGPAAARRGNARQYLAFTICGQRHALPVDAVDRIVAPQPLIRLPRGPGGQRRIVGAIELRGQVVPVASIGTSVGETGAYVIVRGTEGPIAIGVERVDRLVNLRPEQISPVRNGDASIDSVGLIDDGQDLLRILSPDRLDGRG